MGETISRLDREEGLMLIKKSSLFIVVWVLFVCIGLPLSAAPAALGSRTLREGVRGEDVRELQTALAELGYRPLAVDGHFGPQTKARVIEFQKANNVPATGVFAKLSLAALQKVKAARVKADTAARQAAEKTAALEEGFYRVRKGDTLRAVADRFGMDLNTLCRYNNILDPNLIYSGQLLLLRPLEEKVSGENAATEALAPAAESGNGEASAETADTVSEPAVAATKMIAFTFNDGPHPEYTPAIAAALARYGGKGTFFVVGKDAEAYPEVMEQLVQSGNEIGNHTYAHQSFTNKREAEIEADIRQADAVIQPYTGTPSRYFRPAGGEMSQAINKVLARTGHSLVLWSNLGGRDNLNPGSDAITGSVLQTAYDGAIIMLHATNAQTAAALPGILDKLRQEGFRFVTLSELLSK